jgi:hypothetical protein
MRLFLRNNSLTLVFTVLFLGALLGQSVAGWKVFNEEQLAHDSPTISYARYLVTSHFGEAVIENWQSEYLQFTCFILATVWLVQRGSNESKKPEDAGLESDAKQLIGAHAQQNSPAWAKLGDWRTAIYSNSLLIVMGLLFLGSWFAQSVTAWTEYNSEQREHDESGVSWAGYLARARTSGRKRSRTGNRSSSRSRRWPFSRCIYDSAARLNRNRSERPTTRLRARARRRYCHRGMAGSRRFRSKCVGERTGR